MLATTKKGFTLVEMMVAISIFIVIMVISLSSIFNVLDSYRKTKSLKIVITNLNLALDSMAREIRFGTKYHCGSYDDVWTNTQNCSSPETFLTFLSEKGNQVSYKFENNSIKRADRGQFSSEIEKWFIPVTAPEIIIDQLSFYVLGATSGDGFQPRVLINIKAHAGQGGIDNTSFTLQTTLSQRKLDL